MTMTKLRIAVLMGGPSSEAEVSRRSAAGVRGALAKAGHDATLHELDDGLFEALRGGGYDIVFPVAHGAVGEDGSLQGLLEVLALPYVGSAVLASALAMDKRMARRVFAADGLPVAKGLAARRGDDARAVAERARREIGPRLVVKPSSHGSAIGVARLDEASSVDAVAAAIDAAFAFDDTVLVEHFARGREVTCGVLDVVGVDRAGFGGPDGHAFPPTEITAPNDAFYTFQARYAPGRSAHVCPAALGSALSARVQELAVRAHRSLGCRDLSRVDFVVGDDDDAGAVTLLEVNTMPGFTPTSLYPEAAEVAGLGFPKLCDALARAAFARGRPARVAALPFPS